MPNLNQFFLGIFMIFLALFSACQEEEIIPCLEHITEEWRLDSCRTNIRIQNNSNYDFCNVVFQIGEGQTNYGSIASGQSTGFIPFYDAYNSGFLQLYVGAKEFTFVPKDSLNLQLLDEGEFTFHVDIEDFSAGLLSIDLNANKLYTCKKETTVPCPSDKLPYQYCREDPELVNVRIINLSEYDLCDFKMRIFTFWVTLEDGYIDQFIGNIESNDTTCYYSFPVIGNTPEFVQFFVGNKEFSNQLFELADEPRFIGYYSYLVDIPDDLFDRGFPVIKRVAD